VTVIPKLSYYYRTNSGEQPNAVCVEVNGTQFYFSYQTCVAFRHKGKLVVCENIWSATTGRHLNAIDGGAREQRVGWAEFEQLLEEATNA
jgi:hypothetical protein